MIKRLLSPLGIEAKFYSNPDNVGGWVCWLENACGKCLGFIHRDGRVLALFNW